MYLLFGILFDFCLEICNICWPCIFHIR